MMRRTVFPAACAAVFGLSACAGPDCTPEPPGVADVRVTVTRGEGVDEHLVAEVVDWRIGPHPQVPDGGDHLFFRVGVTPVPGFYVVDESVALQACAIDAQRVVVGCAEVFVEVAADGSATTGEGELWPADVGAIDGVVVLSNRLDGGAHGCEDPKDFDGYTPPRLMGPGERV